MLKSQSLSCVNVSDIMKLLGFNAEEQEDLFSGYLDWVSYGDAQYTLVGNVEFIHSIMDYLDSIGRNDEEIGAIVNAYWENISKEDFINMED